MAKLMATCPQCGLQYSLPESCVGQNLRCGGCSQGFVVVAPHAAATKATNPPPLQRSTPSVLEVSRATVRTAAAGTRGRLWNLDYSAGKMALVATPEGLLYQELLRQSTCGAMPSLMPLQKQLDAGADPRTLLPGATHIPWSAVRHVAARSIGGCMPKLEIKHVAGGGALESVELGTCGEGTMRGLIESLRSFLPGCRISEHKTQKRAFDFWTGIGLGLLFTFFIFALMMVGYTSIEEMPPLPLPVTIVGLLLLPALSAGLFFLELPHLGAIALVGFLCLLASVVGPAGMLILGAALIIGLWVFLIRTWLFETEQVWELHPVVGPINRPPPIQVTFQ